MDPIPPPLRVPCWVLTLLWCFAIPSRTHSQRSTKGRPLAPSCRLRTRRRELSSLCGTVFWGLVRVRHWQAVLKRASGSALWRPRFPDLERKCEESSHTRSRKRSAAGSSQSPDGPLSRVTTQRGRPEWFAKQAIHLKRLSARCRRRGCTVLKCSIRSVETLCEPGRAFFSSISVRRLRRVQMTERYSYFPYVMFLELSLKRLHAFPGKV